MSDQPVVLFLLVLIGCSASAGLGFAVCYYIMKGDNENDGDDY